MAKKRRWRFPHALLSIAALLIFSGCSGDNKQVASEFIELGAEGLVADRLYNLESFYDSLQPPHSSVTPRLVVRYSDSCEADSLILKIETSWLSADSVYDCNLRLPLFDNHGNPQGKGSLGLYEVVEAIPVNVKLEEGLYFSILSPRSAPGVVSLGVVLAEDLNNN